MDILETERVFYDIKVGTSKLALDAENIYLAKGTVEIFITEDIFVFM